MNKATVKDSFTVDEIIDKDEVLKMAKTVRNIGYWDVFDLVAFAKLVAAQATAKERDDIWEMACDYTQRYNSHVCLALADAIRARGEA
jgi:hypothetical protein